jgi:CheY-like chemotaxis protein
LLAEGGVQALHLLRKQVFAAVVCDYEMPGMNGGELAAEIKRSRPRMPFLLISGHRISA